MPLNWNFPAMIGPKTGRQVTAASEERSSAGRFESIAVGLVTELCRIVWRESGEANNSYIRGNLHRTRNQGRPAGTEAPKAFLCMPSHAFIASVKTSQIGQSERSNANCVAQEKVDRG